MPILLLVSNLHRLFSWGLSTVLKAPTTIGLTVIFILSIFFSLLTRSRYLSSFSLTFIFAQGSAGTTKSTSREVIFFLIITAIIIIIILQVHIFFLQRWVVVFHWSLSDNSPQDSTRYSSWFWQFTSLHAFCSLFDFQFLPSFFFSKLMGEAVLSASGTIGITVTLIEQQLFQLISKTQIFVYRFTFFFFFFALCFTGTAKSVWGFLLVFESQQVSSSLQDSS